MKVEFLTTLDLRFVDGVNWQLTAPFVAVVTEGDAQRIIRVPAGYVTDLASIPRLPLIFLHFANMAGLPALVHDWLYSEGGAEKDRVWADSVFLEGMLSSGLTEADANAMFRGVRAFGGKHFNYVPPLTATVLTTEKDHV